MAKFLSSFEKLGGLDGVSAATKSTLRCTAFNLEDGRLCLFSPVAGLGDAAQQSLHDLGEVAFLLAPNHYHNKGIAEYGDAYPDAILCAPDAAIPRLENITGRTLDSLDALTTLLGDRFTILKPDGLKTGEIWLRAEAGGDVTWFVVDAFSGTGKSANNIPVTEPGLLKAFPNFGVANKSLYRSWVEDRIKADRPKCIVPCHGAIMQAPDLPDKLLNLMAQTF